MGTIIFRHYRVGDEKQLANLYNLVFRRSVTTRTTTSWLWRYINSPGFEPQMCQIAEDIDKKMIIGAILVNLIEKIPIGQKEYLIADINDVSTHPDYTKRGIATKLMENSIKYMKEKGCDFSILSTGIKNFARSKLYHKFGYFDVEKECIFVQIPDTIQLMRNIFGIAFLYPLFFTLSYLPRFLYRLRLKLLKYFKDFSYEINQNSKHFEYMHAINKISPNIYDGYPSYDKTKVLWARIEVPSKEQRPTYIIIRKNGKIIGGSVITHRNVNVYRNKLKLRLGIIHEIFLDLDIFNNSYNLYFGYIYLIDKIIKAATQRRLAVLVYESSLKANYLNRAFSGMKFLRMQNDVIMIKEVKNNLKFPKYRKPLFLPTYVSLGVP